MYIFLPFLNSHMYMPITSILNVDIPLVTYPLVFLFKGLYNCRVHPRGPVAPVHESVLSYRMGANST